MSEPSKAVSTLELSQVILEGFQEIIGQAGVSATFHMVGLNYLVTPVDRHLVVTAGLSAMQFGQLRGAMEKLYGPRGSRGVCLRSGRASFRYLLNNFGNAMGIGDLDYRLLPTPRRIFTGLEAVAAIFREHFQQSVEVKNEAHHWTCIIHNCLECNHREYSAEPICYYTLGLLQEYFSWASAGKYYNVQEVTCVACDAPVCTFHISKQVIE